MILRDVEKIKRRLLKEGWEPREGANHTVFTHPKKEMNIAVPRHKGELTTGTAKDIAKKAGW
ncbi:MAG: type II toxin-antitoxin system HicA family toxin [Methylobacteriaceae bacterium]|jgi:predicted RNA binding protein YcfA (HicA-like mRNA interferase family)|nr:type II toxin-antitoxin system HicA family toxin [Methylobacteriaceae bacterium]